MKHINWSDMVKEYKEQYDNEYYIGEFVESLVPHNYYEILKVFNNMTYRIQEHHSSSTSGISNVKVLGSLPSSKIVHCSFEYVYLPLHSLQYLLVTYL